MCPHTLKQAELHLGTYLTNVKDTVLKCHCEGGPAPLLALGQMSPWRAGIERGAPSGPECTLSQACPPPGAAMEHTDPLPSGLQLPGEQLIPLRENKVDNLG